MSSPNKTQEIIVSNTGGNDSWDHNVWHKVARFYLSVTDNKSVGRPIPIDFSMQDKADEKIRVDLDSVAERFQSLKFERSKEWIRKSPVQIADISDPHNIFKPIKIRTRIKAVGPYRAMCLPEELFAGAPVAVTATPNIRTTCGLVIEDESGFTMQTSLIHSQQLAKAFWANRGPRLQWDLYGVSFIWQKCFLFQLLDAQMVEKSQLQSPVYSNPNQTNVALDIIKYYGGQSGILIQTIRPEIEARFGTDLSYHMIWRALDELCEYKRKGILGTEFKIPKNLEDTDGITQLEEQFQRIQDNNKPPK